MGRSVSKFRGVFDTNQPKFFLSFRYRKLREITFSMTPPINSLSPGPQPLFDLFSVLFFVSVP